MSERTTNQASSSKDVIRSQSTGMKKLSEKARGKKRMMASSSKQEIAPPITKKVSPYNKFMKNEYDKIKKSNPGINHKRAFNMAAANWTGSPSNPKNKNKKTTYSYPASSKLTLG